MLSGKFFTEQEAKGVHRVPRGDHKRKKVENHCSTLTLLWKLYLPIFIWFCDGSNTWLESLGKLGFCFLKLMFQSKLQNEMTERIWNWVCKLLQLKKPSSLINGGKAISSNESFLVDYLKLLKKNILCSACYKLLDYWNFLFYSRRFAFEKIFPLFRILPFCDQLASLCG